MDSLADGLYLVGRLAGLKPVRYGVNNPDPEKAGRPVRGMFSLSVLVAKPSGTVDLEHYDVSTHAQDGTETDFGRTLRARLGLENYEQLVAAAESWGGGAGPSVLLQVSHQLQQDKDRDGKPYPPKIKRRAWQVVAVQGAQAAGNGRVRAAS